MRDRSSIGYGVYELMGFGGRCPPMHTENLAGECIPDKELGIILGGPAPLMTRRPAREISRPQARVSARVSQWEATKKKYRDQQNAAISAGDEQAAFENCIKVSEMSCPPNVMCKQSPPLSIRTERCKSQIQQAKMRTDAGRRKRGLPPLVWKSAPGQPEEKLHGIPFKQLLIGVIAVSAAVVLLTR